MIRFSKKYRSDQAEIMDDFQLQGDEMKKLLTDLDRVNRYLGGNQITLSGLSTLLKGQPKDRTYHILDLGCGDGQLLRRCARWGKQRGYRFHCLGVDANAHILEEARRRSQDYSNIAYKQLDAFDVDSPLPEFDIGLCTLFLHHFDQQRIQWLLSRMSEQAGLGIVVNDLQRSIWAFRLFKLISPALLRTRIARHDGLVSIARSFRREELLKLAQAIPGFHQIRWRWAFRYQWIINKTANSITL